MGKVMGLAATQSFNIANFNRLFGGEFYSLPEDGGDLLDFAYIYVDLDDDTTVLLKIKYKETKSKAYYVGVMASLAAIQVGYTIRLNSRVTKLVGEMRLKEAEAFTYRAQVQRVVNEIARVEAAIVNGEKTIEVLLRTANSEALIERGAMTAKDAERLRNSAADMQLHLNAQQQDLKRLKQGYSPYVAQGQVRKTVPNMIDPTTGKFVNTRTSGLGMVRYFDDAGQLIVEGLEESLTKQRKALSWASKWGKANIADLTVLAVTAAIDLAISESQEQSILNTVDEWFQSTGYEGSITEDYGISLPFSISDIVLKVGWTLAISPFIPDDLPIDNLNDLSLALVVTMLQSLFEVEVVAIFDVRTIDLDIQLNPTKLLEEYAWSFIKKDPYIVVEGFLIAYAIKVFYGLYLKPMLNKSVMVE
jgi:hypothetical protein